MIENKKLKELQQTLQNAQKNEKQYFENFLKITIEKYNAKLKCTRNKDFQRSLPKNQTSNIQSKYKQQKQQHTDPVSSVQNISTKQASPEQKQKGQNLLLHGQIQPAKFTRSKLAEFARVKQVTLASPSKSLLDPRAHSQPQKKSQAQMILEKRANCKTPKKNNNISPVKTVSTSNKKNEHNTNNNAPDTNANHLTYFFISPEPSSDFTSPNSVLNRNCKQGLRQFRTFQKFILCEPDHQAVLNQRQQQQCQQQDELMKQDQKEIQKIIINQREKMKTENDELSLKKLASLSYKLQGIEPKFVHKFVHKLAHKEQSFDRIQKFGTNSTRFFTQGNDYVKLNLTVQPKNAAINLSLSNKKTNNAELASNSIQLKSYQQQQQQQQSLEAPLLDSLTNQTYSYKLSKMEIFSYYCGLLKKLELIKFALNYNNFDKKDPQIEFHKSAQAYQIEIDNVKITNQEDEQIYNFISNKLGHDYYIMLKKLFNMYSEQQKNSKVLSFRQFSQFCSHFSLQFKATKINVQSELGIFFQGHANKYANFQQFIEIIFKMFQKQNQITTHSDEDYQFFKKFLDENIVPKFKELTHQFYSHNLEKISIFDKNSSESENPILCLLYENDNLLKHIFGIYETSDLKCSEFTFISLRNFLKFCTDYSIIPAISNLQCTKVFRIFQIRDQDIIGFSSFVMILCCLAHIGFSTQKYIETYRTYYKKLWRFFQNLIDMNSDISEILIEKQLKINRE